MLLFLLLVSNSMFFVSRMFWRVVSHMNNNQRQQLLYFATGSASLPATNDQEPCKYIPLHLWLLNTIHQLPNLTSADYFWLYSIFIYCTHVQYKFCAIVYVLVL